VPKNGAMSAIGRHRSLVALAVAAAASPAGASSGSAQQSDAVHGAAQHPSFDEYLGMYGLAYGGAERSNRERAYARELELIDAHNEKSDRTWTATVNQFTILTPDEMQHHYGLVRRAAGEAAQFFAAPPAAAPKPNATPSEFDWRTERPNVVTAVKDQGGCGSCWAFAAAEVLESAVAIGSGKLFDLSPQDLVACTPNPNLCGGSGGCDGATPQLAFEYVKKHGISSEWSTPYTSGMTGKNGECLKDSKTREPVAGIGGFVDVLKNDAESLLQAVLVSPVAVSVAASGWSRYKEGVFSHASCDFVINHAVVVNGYGTQNTTSYWLIRNSWGPMWGEDGYIRLERAKDPEQEPCGWDTKPLDGSACKTPLDGSKPPEKVWVCGTCGVLADSTYPVGTHLGAPRDPQDPALNTSRPAASFATTPAGSGARLRGSA